MRVIYSRIMLSAVLVIAMLAAGAGSGRLGHTAAHEPLANARASGAYHAKP